VLDVSSLPAFLRSLHLTGPVTTRPGRVVAGPPAPLFELALRLGLGPRLLDTPRNRAIVSSLGIRPAHLSAFGRRIRSRKMWRALWEEFAAPHIAEADAARARGEREAFVQEAHTALALIGMAYGGDGYYIHTHMRENRRARPVRQRLLAGLREMSGDRVERLRLERTSGLLRFPPGYAPAAGRAPALLAIHPLGWDQDTFDDSLALFRGAGYATLAIDLPAHGENFDGPRLQADDEAVAVAALDALAAHPAIDAGRLGVIGGSLGAFFALRTAAASPRVKACAAFASPFDIGATLHLAVPGIQENMAWVLGAPTLPEAYRLAAPFHLRGVVEKIKCPICLVHGTEDHICDFSGAYEIARRAAAPLAIYPRVGVDHEAANPATPQIAAPALDWLKRNL
jgi:dipeptidyl aminopeptidase/acylaminoacyl peptidase